MYVYNHHRGPPFESFREQQCDMFHEVHEVDNVTGLNEVIEVNDGNNSNDVQHIHYAHWVHDGVNLVPWTNEL